MMQPDLREYLGTRKALVDCALEDMLPPVAVEPKAVHEAMRYATLSGGKRLRPILALAVSEVMGRPLRDVLEAACAVELVHTASLVLDDLPSMDNASSRRNRACTHTQFGEATAILASLGLIALAFDLVARNAQHATAPDVVTRAVHVLSHAVGTAGIILGQYGDLNTPRSAGGLGDLETIHQHKAGALFLASVQLPALLIGMSESDTRAIERYAKCIGLAFQVTDDLLDAENPSEDAGKMTFSTFLGPTEASERAAQLLDQGVQAIETFGSRAAPLRLLADYVRARTT